MDDDKLLRSLGAAAAAQQRAGEESTWERVIKRELTAVELAELERLAEGDPEIRELLAASRPLEASAKDRIANALGDALAVAGSPAAALRPAQWRARVGILGGGLALAAGIALLVGRTGGDPLPPYFLDASGVASSRGPADPLASCALHAGPRGSFELLARPNDAVFGTIAAHAFLVRGNEVEAFPSAIEISPRGSVRLFDENRKLRGAAELRLVVGRGNALTPSDAQSFARNASASGPGWQVLRCAVEQDPTAP